MNCTRSDRDCSMTLAGRSTRWLTVSRPKSRNPIGRGTGDDEPSDARERRSQAFRQWKVNCRRPVISNVGPAESRKLSCAEGQTKCRRHRPTRLIANLFESTPDVHDAESRVRFPRAIWAEESFVVLATRVSPQHAPSRQLPNATTVRS